MLHVNEYPHKTPLPSLIIAASGGVTVTGGVFVFGLPLASTAGSPLVFLRAAYGPPIVYDKKKLGIVGP